MLNEGYGIVL